MKNIFTLRDDSERETGVVKDSIEYMENTFGTPKDGVLTKEQWVATLLNEINEREDEKHLSELLKKSKGAIERNKKTQL